MSKIQKKLKKQIVNVEILKMFLYFKYLYFFLKKFKNFPEFSDKIYNSYNKAPQKCLEYFDKFR